jgi:hypothetical protein
MRTRVRGVPKPKPTISMAYETMVDKTRFERNEWKSTHTNIED